jgi:putative DNA primase/helicase
MNAIVPIPVDDPLQMAWLDCNDLGNAERLKRLAAGLLLWVEELGWLAYDTRRWSAEEGELRANQLAHDVARHIDREAAALDQIAEDPQKLEAAFGWQVPVGIAQDRVVKLRKHAVASGDASRTAAMLKQARTFLSARLDTFDRDPLAFNVQNGTLRFFQATGGGWDARLDAHEPSDRLMQVANFTYDRAADCPQWIERMKLIQPKKDQRALLQQLYGYCLTALTSEQKWFIYQGRGGDGKSLTNHVIAEEMGDYFRHADVSTFLKSAQQKSGSEHSADLERLSGDIRLVVCDEPDRNATWNGGRLKQVTGSKITARGVGAKKTIEYYPRWKLIVEVNPLPAVPSDDDGFWRRCRPVPWKFQFNTDGVAEEAFDVVVDRLRCEASGILNWMIAGALKWLETRRLPDSEDALELRGNYRQSASPFGEWLGEQCDTADREVKTPSGTLYADFKEWCERAGLEKIPTQTAFGRALRDRQHLEWKDPKGNRYRRGIKLKTSDAGPLSAAASSPAGPAQSVAGGGGRAEASNFGTEDDDDVPL